MKGAPTYLVKLNCRNRDLHCPRWRCQEHLGDATCIKKPQEKLKSLAQEKLPDHGDKGTSDWVSLGCKRPKASVRVRLSMYVGVGVQVDSLGAGVCVQASVCVNV